MSESNKIARENPSANTLAPLSVQVNGLRVRYCRSGSGPVLVLVHGLLGYSFSWRFVMPALSKGHEVVALDMPGAGFSDCSASLDCRLESAAQRLLSFLDAVGISTCDLVGSSYGGATAITAAALAGGRVRSLVLVSPANPWSSIGRMRIRALSLPLMSSIFPPAARAFAPLNTFSIARMFGDSRRMPPSTVRGYNAAMARPGVIEHAVRIVNNWRGDMKEFETALAKVADIPALLLWGSKDRVVDLRSAAVLSQHFRHAQTAVIEGAGHLPYEECPEEFSRLVLNFLAQQESVRVDE